MKKYKMLPFSPDCRENPPDFSSGDCNGKRDNIAKKRNVSAPKSFQHDLETVFRF
jgi:hypothetical protein